MPSDNDSIDFELSGSDSKDPVLQESRVVLPCIDASKSDFQHVCVVINFDYTKD
jgi:hypothetical protein